MDIFTTKEYLEYSVGAMIYTPASNDLVGKRFANHFPFSLALCLEDSIMDGNIAFAQQKLLSNLEIRNSVESLKECKMIFIRVRTPDQLREIYRSVFAFRGVVAGFILPKFDTSNALEYEELISEIYKESSFYFMPILETKKIMSAKTRTEELLTLKNILDSVRDAILNVRVGGNDFCNIYAVRRNTSQTIYDIGVLNSVLCDIMNVFGADYVLSAPVWEYFKNENVASDAWETGLRREIEFDKLNGFIGKTAIHPSQIPIIADSLKVNYWDYKDALAIINWKNDVLAVSKSAEGTRMNEFKVHAKWARKIILLSEIYGVRDEA